MNKFEVSVIIPVYNAEKFIERAIESGLSQPEVKEIILIEDGSPDHAFEICSSWSKKNDRVKLYRHTNGENRGAGASRNLGIDKASCDFISFLDADDFYLKNRFVKTKEVFSLNKKVEAVYECIGTNFYSQAAKVNFKKLNRSNLTTLKPGIRSENVFEELLVGRSGWIHLNGFTVKRNSILNKIYFDESLLQAQDTDWLRRVAEKCCLKEGEVTKPIAMRGIHQENRILNKRRASLYRHQLYSKWFNKMISSNWPKSINRRFYFEYCKHFYTGTESKYYRRFLVIIKFVTKLIQKPIIIRKLI
ncbi:glycosyltransferase family 2 protein [Membranihabitans maritimus]|uniref:glycosyltransferase family 2 protein n=1 Tax=Membranihabitans maritimus TaxID=2904244 RepID=UPI001F33E61F|nr:glycosyltransferase family 2 protein [Membranihabitans maritimus]